MRRPTLITVFMVAFLPSVLSGCGGSDKVDPSPMPTPDMLSPTPADATSPPDTPGPTPSDATSPPQVAPTTTPVPDADGDGIASPGDCDDSDPGSFPGAMESCDGTDNDCDGEVDELLLGPWYPDADGDGWGDSDATGVTGCVHAESDVIDDQDCDDADAAVNPAAAEVCDEIDNDCDGHVDAYLDGGEDDGLGSTWFPDADGDGYGALVAVLACPDSPGYVQTIGDCDDADAAVHPGAPEICDGKDSDCTFETTELRLYFPDTDGDGYGAVDRGAMGCTAPSGWVEATGDCDDADGTAYPGAPELCDGIDNDCNGPGDDGLTLFFRDADGDGFGIGTDFDCVERTGFVPARGDCDDMESSIHPGADDPPDTSDQDCGGTGAAEPHVGLGSSSRASIQEALDAASDGATVWVGPGTWEAHDLDFRGRAVVLASTALAEKTRIDAAGYGRHFHFHTGEGPATRVDGFSLLNGAASQGGAIAFDASSPTILGCILRSNLADYGGAVSLEGSSPTFRDCIFTQNAALSRGCSPGDSYYDPLICDGGDGGGVWMHDSSPVFERCRIDGNAATLRGGGIFGLDSSPVLRVTVVDANRTSSYCLESYGGNDCSESLSYLCAGGNGGGVYLEGGAPVLVDVSIEGNIASGDGGGLYARELLAALSGSRVAGNTSTRTCEEGYRSYCTDAGCLDGIIATCYGGSGGGIYLDGAIAEIAGTHLEGNAGNLTGGGLFLRETTGTLQDIVVAGNRLSEACHGITETCEYSSTYCGGWESTLCEETSGGGVYATLSDARIEGAVFYRNVANRGAGTFHRSDSTGLYDGWLAANRAVAQVLKRAPSTCMNAGLSYTNVGAGIGGGVYLEEADPVLSRLRLEQNSAEAGCATSAMPYADGGYSTVDCRGGSGGGIFLLSSPATLERLMLIGNQAHFAGGLYARESAAEISWSTLTGQRLYNVCSTMILEAYGDETTELSCWSGEVGGVYLDGAFRPVITSAILALNAGYNLYGDYASSEPTGGLAWCDLYNPPGDPNHNLASLAGTNLSLEPAFLTYRANGLPLDLHLDIGSPLIDLGDPEAQDPDGSRADMGAFAGPGADGWDVDGDGAPAWYWPGTLEDAPAGVDPEAFDGDDLNPSAPAP